MMGGERFVQTPEEGEIVVGEYRECVIPRRVLPLSCQRDRLVSLACAFRAAVVEGDLDRLQPPQRCGFLVPVRRPDDRALLRLRMSPLRNGSSRHACLGISRTVQFVTLHRPRTVQCRAPQGLTRAGT